MKWTNQFHEMDELAEIICDKKETFYIWGTANIAKNFLQLCDGELTIAGAVDIDTKRQGELFCGMIIESPAALQDRENVKIIVTTSKMREVRAELKKMGYRENIDFFDYFVFLQIFEMYRHHRLYSRRLDISLTERCTLKCEKCNMFMPYYKNPSDLNKEDVKKQIDQYFAVVDYVECLNLLGGEPFLYDGLADVIEYIGDRYRAKLEHLQIFTNGMILPDTRLLDVMYKYRVEVQISDYTIEVPYEQRLQQMAQILQERDIRYSVVGSDRWGDFGFPENPNQITEHGLEEFFEKCKAPFRGLYKGRVYFCHLETSAIRAGLFQDNENDYFDLQQQDEKIKLKFLEFDFGFSKLGGLTFCSVCRGCDPANKLTVPAAKQL